MNPDLHDDDRPVGRLLSRREALRLFGGAGAALVAGTALSRIAHAQTAAPTATGTALPACVVKPEMTEGPFFNDDMLNRTDIRIEPSTGAVSEGVPLRLNFHVTQVDGATCTPIENAQVDVWHCDAFGRYSGESSNNTAGLSFLRGYELTDALGMASFITIYPGWYPGRTPHIHFKIRTDPESDRGYEFTSQLFFDDTLSDEVYDTMEPYNGRGSARRATNENDGLFAGSDGLLTLDVKQDEEGFTATFDIALDLDEVTATPVSGG
jgi:protocatechuate 3,4-dioxygenase beta subunit